ncbi:hypothetical protein [Chryseobacterium vrystaatense]|uniref:Uncharacterized protein n=1 Tax=Chryseobacterium vrystaatense TaxID=307480 RepID=A0A1M4ZK89_9FLAO|nr:hypothetical protein [Chryseobacterium vrystaatense]SHF18232.1 hypothetical protein SAMN02787073_1618 [Chryseobacterium vrystaatense]
MQNKEEAITRISTSLGISYSEVETMMYKGVSFNDINESKIEELKQAMEQQELVWLQPKRRKPTNYTKPRDRKKKPKNKRR